MIALHALALLVAAQTLLHGYVTPYSPGVMEAVLERRQSWGQVADAHGCLAALNVNRIGERILVLHPHGATICTVVDVAQPRHAVERERQRLILEVDAETYRQMGRGPVTVAVME